MPQSSFIPDVHCKRIHSACLTSRTTASTPMPALLRAFGTSTRRVQPRGKSPGRPTGFRPTKVTRFPVLRKMVKQPSSDG